MNSNMNTRATIKIDRDVHSKFKELCEIEGRKMSTMLSILLNVYDEKMISEIANCSINHNIKVQED